MNFDFYDQFKDHSTFELLKIVKAPSGYQPEAIEAVNKVLSERNITQADIEEVDAYFNEQKSKVERKAEKINAFKEKAADLLEPITNPGPEIKPVKWLNILLPVIGLQYLWQAYNMLRYLIGYLQCRTCTIDITVFLNVAILIYPLIIFYLLLKRRRWGWILLFADNLFSLVAGIGQLWSFFEYRELYQRFPVSLSVTLLIRSGFCYFLWRKDIAGLFGIHGDNIKKKALVAVIIAAILLAIVGYYWISHMSQELDGLHLWLKFN